MHDFVSLGLVPYFSIQVIYQNQIMARQKVIPTFLDVCHYIWHPLPPVVSDIQWNRYISILGYIQIDRYETNLTRTLTSPLSNVYFNNLGNIVPFYGIASFYISISRSTKGFVMSSSLSVYLEQFLLPVLYNRRRSGCSIRKKEINNMHWFWKTTMKNDSQQQIISK